MIKMMNENYEVTNESYAKSALFFTSGPLLRKFIIGLIKLSGNTRTYDIIKIAEPMSQS